MRVHSIFRSIAGEVCPYGQGVYASFIRVQGCNIRCNWCDTPDAQSFKSDKGLVLIADVAEYLIKEGLAVIITGGEPLSQVKEVKGLCSLLETNLNVVIETNGTLPIFTDLTNVVWSVDWKPPSSGEHGKFLEKENYFGLPYGSQIKCVVDTLEDLRSFLSWAERMGQKLPEERVEPSLILSATSPEKLKTVFKIIEFFRKDNLYNIRKRRLWFNLQIHKILGLA